MKTPTQTTLDYFNATKAQPLNTQSGRLTLRQVCEMTDAISAVRTVCHHVLNGHDAPHYVSRIAALGINLSIAQAIQALKTWEKWTRWQDNGSAVPTLSQVQSFLSDAYISNLNA